MQTNGFDHFQYFLVPIVSGIESLPINLDHQKETISIGRGTENNIILPIQSASRFHAKFTFDQNNFYLEDLGSTHGTFIGQTKLEIQKKQLLQNKDMIRFSIENTWYEYNCPEEESEQIDQKETLNDIEFAANILKNEKKKSIKSQYIDILKAYGKIKKNAENDESESSSDDLSENNVDIEIFDTKLIRLLPDLTIEQVEKLDEFEIKTKQLEKSQFRYEDILQKNSEVVGEDEGEKESKAQKKVSKQLFDLRNKQEKLSNELEELQDEIREMIFDKKKQEHTQIDVRDFWQENNGLVDISQIQPKKEKMDILQEKLPFELDKLIKNRLILQDELAYEVNSAVLSQNTSEEERDEYDDFMDQTEKKVNQEKLLILNEKIGKVTKEINEVFLKMKLLSSNSELKLDAIVKKVEDETISLRNSINKNRNQPIKVDFKKNLLEMQKRHVSGFYEEEEDVKVGPNLNKLRHMTESNEKPILPQDLKKVKSEFLISPEIEEQEISQTQIDAISTEKTKKSEEVSNYFQDLGY